MKKSHSFFYNLLLDLTKSHHYDQYNIASYLLPFCSHEQIIDFLSKQSIKKLDYSYLLSRKLSNYQPLICLEQLSQNSSNFFKVYDQLLTKLIKQEPKKACHLLIDHLKQLDIHERLLPYLFRAEQKYLFKKAPDEMIEIITLAAANEPGEIKSHAYWNIDGFEFPRSFSLQNYVRLFSALYDTCKWSTNHTMDIFRFMLRSKNRLVGLSSIRKQRKWVIDIVINQYIGRELFFEKLIQEGNEQTLEIFSEYAEITSPLSVNLISEQEAKKNIPMKTRLSLLRYQYMTDEVFNEFISLFSRANVNREDHAVLLLQCAFATDDEQVMSRVLQWIEKRFTNERFFVIQRFIDSLSQLNNRFHLEIVPKNVQTIHNIIRLAFRHFQQSTSVILAVSSYGLLLLERGEYHHNKQIQSFAYEILQECFSIEECLRIQISSLPLGCPKARHLLAEIFVSNVFSKYLSRTMLTDLNDSIVLSFEKPWLLPTIDSFLHSFFYDHLPTSNKLQTAFQIDKNSFLISIFLKNRSTQHERVKHLINNIDRSFFFNQTVQSIVLHSKEYREFLDRLLENNQCLTIEQLTTNDNNRLILNLETEIKYKKFPGLCLEILVNNSSRYLTGKQQEHIAKMILNDYLQDKEVSNLNKLKSLRILRRLTHAYPIILEWYQQKQKDSIFAIQGVPDTSSYRGTRGANAQSIDDIVLCLPSTLDLSSIEFFKHIEFLKTKLNASNAKYISDALRKISRQIPDPVFLEYYLQLIRDEQFQRLGITVNKEILRLLTEYTCESKLIKLVIEPFWQNRPHQDVRACLVFTLIYFLDRIQTNEEKELIWNIFEQATTDYYLPVIQSLFSEKNQCSKEIFQEFVNRIQMKVLDHRTSIEARSWAWKYISSQDCDSKILLDKAKQVCTRFDKDSKALWEDAFNLIISFTKKANSEKNIIVEIIQQLISYRTEIDSKENGINNQHDLPVYHRIHRILNILTTHIRAMNDSAKQSIRCLGSTILEFDPTFAPLLSKLLFQIAETRDDLQSIFVLLRTNLPQDYFDNVLFDLSKYLSNESSCPFIQKLNINEKFDLARWFFHEKDYEILTFEFVKKQVFKQSGVDRDQCRDLLRQMRQSENLLVRQQTLQYVVPWKAKKTKRTKQPKEKSNSDINDEDLLDIFSES